MLKSDDSAPNGRWVYLSALEEHWPEVLMALRRDVLPLYNNPPIPRGSPLWETTPIRDEWSRIANHPDCGEMIAAINKWADDFKIRDTWILNAALQTMNFAVRMEVVAPGYKTNWMYVSPSELSFTAKLGQREWLPTPYGNGESWKDFSSGIVAELKSQLAKYRIQVDKRYGIGPPEMARDARWTVLYQQGQSPGSISKELHRAYSDPAQTVFRAVTRFAIRIGLTLRNKT